MGWVKYQGGCWEKLFPGKGSGVINYGGSVFYWGLWLCVEGGLERLWTRGRKSTLEEAKKIIEETFELIEPLDKE